MPHQSVPFTKKDFIKTIAITVLFNTLIALIIKYVVLSSHAFIDVWVVSQFIGLSICMFVSQATQKKAEESLPTLISYILGGLVLGITTGSFLAWLYLYIFHSVDFLDFFTRYLFYTFVFGVVFGVPIIYFFSSWFWIQESEKQIQEEKIKRLTMEKEAAMVSLRLLQAQIEPHFLFNTLSNVISLFDIDTHKAKKMLVDINEYLRISLQRTRKEMVTLDQELSLVKHYLEIFKIRMGKRLSYEINNSIKLPDISFPPLLIQPLVENAIKYGLEPKEEGGKISIDCTMDNNHLIIVVADTGRGLDQDANLAGIGINNVSKRLENMFGQNAKLELKQNTPCGLKAVIEVPL